MQEDAGLRWLYDTVPGRTVLKMLTAPGLSRLCGRFLDSPFSAGLIPLFIRKYQIDMTEAAPCRYRCFNEFFSRRLTPGSRPLDTDPQHLTAPCDGLLSVYRIRSGIKSTVIKQNRHYGNTDFRRSDKKIFKITLKNSFFFLPDNVRQKHTN